MKAISYRKTQQNPNTVLTILFSCDTRYPRTVYLIHPYKSTLRSGTDRHLQFIIPRQQISPPSNPNSHLSPGIKYVKTILINASKVGLFHSVDLNLGISRRPTPRHSPPRSQIRSLKFCVHCTHSKGIALWAQPPQRSRVPCLRGQA